MIFRYRIFCWVPPKSGFDLAEHNMYLNQIEKTIPMLFNGNKEIEDIFQEIKEKYDNMVLEVFVIDSDKKFEENREEIIKKVQEKYPGAKIVHYEMIDVYQTKNKIK